MTIPNNFPVIADVKDQVWRQVWGQVFIQIRNRKYWIPLSQYNQIIDQVTNHVRSQVENQICDQVWSQVMNQDIDFLRNI